MLQFLTCPPSSPHPAFRIPAPPHCHRIWRLRNRISGCRLAKMATRSIKRNGSRKRNRNSNSRPHLTLTFMLSQAPNCVPTAPAQSAPPPEHPSVTKPGPPGRTSPLRCIHIRNCFAVDSVYTKCAFVVFGISSNGGKTTELNEGRPVFDGANAE